MSGRSELEFYSAVSNKMIFKKKSNFLLGLIMKSILLRSSLDEGYANFKGGIEQEFSFLTKEELIKSLTEGCKLFKKIIFLNNLM